VLCCIGDLVEDIVARHTSDIRHGTDTDVEIHRRRGGSAANVAAVAAQAGSPVRFIGRVGDDAIGESLVAGLASSGVDTVVQRHGRTGTIVVLVDATGERSMLPDRAAAVDLDAVSEADLDGVTWLHVPAYSLVGGPITDASITAIRMINDRGGAVSIDASSVAIIEAFGVDRFGDLIEELGPNVVLCNRDEADLLGVASGGTLRGVGITVVKDGDGEAVARDSSGTVTIVPAIALDSVRDTTGAGDAFAAGFITAMMEGAEVSDALANGHRTAAGVLTRLAP
jgi:sugar/nucleoside kinase (ribokinase family)